jgi:hypothetical protein
MEFLLYLVRWKKQELEDQNGGSGSFLQLKPKETLKTFAAVSFP